MILSLVATLMIQSQPAAPRPMTPLTQTHRRNMRCAPLFALVSSAQAKSEAYAAFYPPLTFRGRAYFADVGQRIVDETGQPKESVQQEFVAVAWAVQDVIQAAAAPGKAVVSDMTACLPLLDAADAARQGDDTPETAAP